jgi:hypothetical protein
MKCLAQAVAEKSRGQDARLRTHGRTDGRTDGRTHEMTLCGLIIVWLINVVWLYALCGF